MKWILQKQYLKYYHFGSSSRTWGASTLGPFFSFFMQSSRNFPKNYQNNRLLPSLFGLEHTCASCKSLDPPLIEILKIPLLINNYTYLQVLSTNFGCKECLFFPFFQKSIDGIVCIVINSNSAMQRTVEANFPHAELKTNTTITVTIHIIQILTFACLLF